MSQSVRQEARRRALDHQSRRRRERAEAEKRRSKLGVEIAVALGERDDAVARLERVAGEGLLRLTRDEGLTIAEAMEWVEGLTATEARRLRGAAEDSVTEASA